MEIREALMIGKSGTMSKAVVKQAIDHADSFKALMDCFFDKDLMVCQRSAISVGKVAMVNQNLIDPYIKKMIEAQSKPINSAIRRNVVRTLSLIDIPEKYRGEVFDLCFNYLNDPKAAIAIRIFSMAICGKMCKHYPDLKEELLQVLHLHEEFGSPGFKSQARSVRKQLKQMQ